MSKCPTCGAPTNNAPDGNHRYYPSLAPCTCSQHLDVANLQAEVERLRELLAQCREMVLNGVQVAERAYHCWATEGGPLEYDPNDECCTPLRQYRITTCPKCGWTGPQVGNFLWRKLNRTTGTKQAIIGCKYCPKEI